MATKSKSKRSVFAPVRHPFLYDVITGDGKIVKKKAMARVRYSKKPVNLELTAEHVRRSIKLKGIGNTAKCTMAICTYAHADKFIDHEVEGHIDWTYTRAFVVSKLNKYGLPIECVAYEHDNDGIAQLNDSKGGQQKLLKQLLRDGPITIALTPYRKRSTPGRSGAGRTATGRRDAASRLKGANRRYAVYELGALPQAI